MIHKEHRFKRTRFVTNVQPSPTKQQGTFHIWTHQLMNAVNGPVVLVTKSLHALKAGRERQHIKYDLYNLI